MKKTICLLLAVAILLTAALCGAAALGRKGPALGDVVHGFQVKEVRDFPLVGAKIYLFEHQRTGAQLMYIANSDTNRVFDLTFFTRAVDNTGLPHVFEHSTLDGSEKYPSKALFFNLSYQTYNTYMNAMTSALYTTYPVASLSEEQLLRYADYYTDSCLHPTIMTDESIFREEAWRYRLEDEGDELSIEGTVYSEMKGARDLFSTAYTNILRAAFPGSTIGNVSGGEPESIPDMTWDSLRAYHELYYHPSNCIAFLYGQFDDYAAFLKLLDEAFRPYEKKEFRFEDEDYAPLGESTEEFLPFPVEAGSGTENASAAFYAFLCPGAKDDPQEELILNTLTDLMVADGSPLMQNLKRAIPSGSFATYIELDGPEDMIVFYAQNIDPDDASLFKATVDASLAQMADEGFSDELVDSIEASLAISTKLSGESSDIGVDLISDFASYYSATGDPFGYMAYVGALEKIGAWNARGLYTKAIRERLLGDPITALSVTYPESGLREQLDAAEAERLAAVKASMSAEELKAIVEMTNAEDEPDDASAYVKQLQAVTVASLPEEVRSYEVSEHTGRDGVRYVDAVADVDGVGSAILLLDASGLSQEDIHWFALYTALLGEMDTASHDRDELALLTSRYLYDGEIRLSLINTYGTDEFRPCLRAGWTAADGDLEKGYELIYELLYETDFSDTETLAGLIGQNKAALKSSITASPYSTMLYRALGSYIPLYRYYSYFNGIDFYSFLEQAEQLAQSDPEAVCRKLESIRDYFRNRTNAAAVYAGSREGIEINAPLAAGFMEKLDAAPITPAVYELPGCEGSEALIIDSTVQYNGIVADYETLGLEGYSGDLDAVSSLLSDGFLYPQLRDKYGAYGVMTGFVEDAGCYVVSYRDPNVKESFQVYERIPVFFRNHKQDQSELDGYILSSYSYYAKGEGALAGAKDAAICRLTGEPQDLNLGYMRDLKALTPDTVKGYSEVYDKLVKEGLRFTAGGAGAINENAELYDTILNPFGAVDITEIELDDVPEGSEHYDAVRLVFENRIMLPAEGTRFGVDEPATVGDMAIVLHALGIGDVSDPQEALDTLSQFGLLTDAGAAGDPLGGEKAMQALRQFTLLLGTKCPSSVRAEEGGMSRGELAELVRSYLIAMDWIEG
ncbi:MAG: insulinase family protein [Oscillospiraceae bacterium]|nr:insulinase family protein [Oscillospiraceae bacterium]